jgi:hypothetical protein
LRSCKLATDIAQFQNLSVTVEDSTQPVIEVLRKTDPTFRPVPHVSDGRREVSYVAKGGLRVDFLTPNQGQDTERPLRLPAFQTDAQPLRFLAYLIHEPEPAVILHGPGIYVHVPAPERFALHKLIVSRRRHRTAGAKKDKDVKQAELLLAVLVEKRPRELKFAWHEAYERGQTWRRLLTEGMSELAPRIRDETLKTVGVPRSAVPGLDLAFNNPRVGYDLDRDVVNFVGQSLGGKVRCAIRREVLEDHFDADEHDWKGLLEMRQNLSKFEQMARTKYLSWPVEEPEAVLIRTDEVPKLLKDSKLHRPSRAKGRARKQPLPKAKRG